MGNIQSITCTEILGIVNDTEVSIVIACVVTLADKPMTVSVVATSAVPSISMFPKEGY